MENDQQVILKMSDEALVDYVQKMDEHESEVVASAVRELQNRGRIFSEQELENIKIKLQEKRSLKSKEDQKMAKNYWKRNIVSDPNAPSYYSPFTIYLFSLFFSVIVGSVLLALNLTVGKQKWIVTGFGILCTALIIAVVTYFPSVRFMHVILNGLGGTVLTHYFWNIYIGTETKFRTKKIWLPLVVSIILTILFILILIFNR